MQPLLKKKEHERHEGQSAPFQKQQDFASRLEEIQLPVMIKLLRSKKKRKECKIPVHGKRF
jgi:hypothetical protein